MPMLGLEVSKQDIDALFDSWDPDGSGQLELGELNKVPTLPTHTNYDDSHLNERVVHQMIIRAAATHCPLTCMYGMKL